MNRLTKVLCGSVVAMGLFAGGALASPVIIEFSDQDDIAEAHLGSVEWASTYGIVQGYPDGSFRPGTLVSRQQVASMLRGYDLATASRWFEGEPTRIPAGQIVTAVSACPEAWIPISGSYGITDEPDDATAAVQVSVLTNQPAELVDDDRQPLGWETRVANGSNRDVTVQVSVVCTPS